MTIFKPLFYILILTLLFSNCTSDFEAINTNPNAPNSVQAHLLLRQVIYDYGEQMSYEGFVAGDLLAQHRTAIDFNLFDRHALKSPQLGGNPWPILYTNLRDNEILLKQALENPTDNVYEGPARILKAFMAANLTDWYGDVPYFEAFNGKDGTVRPQYDSQEAIYLDPNGILDQLNKGVKAIKNYSGNTALEGDILFNGNLQSWITFANALKIKQLIRISNVVDVSKELQTLFSAKNYIQNNAENASFNFTNTKPNSFRLSQLRVGDFNNFVLSKTMETIMKNLNDTRLELFFRPSSGTNQFNGLTNGIDASQTSIELSNYALAGRIFREDSSPLQANFITAWEVYFNLAEAAERQLITANAKLLYETGVTLAFEYWNTEMPANYLTGTAAYHANNTSPLQQIITQKWIANISNGYESWTEYRRTGFPELPPITASLNNNLIPVRLPYPAEEATLNSDEYAKAANNTNNNSINSPVWWDNN